MSRLDLDLILRRAGWAPWVAAGLLIVALAIQWVTVTKVQPLTTARSGELSHLQQVAAAPPPAPAGKSATEEGFLAFAAVLGDKRDLNRFMSLLFAQAGKNDITLAQAEYKLEAVRQGGFNAYRLTLPVRGGYPQLRRFIDATLEKLPFAALEDVDFKRDAIGTPTTEAKLRFVFFLKDAQS